MGCCAANLCVLRNGNCALGDNNPETAEMNDIIYGNMSCNLGHWCPVGFEYDGQYCRFQGEACFSSPASGSRQCTSYQFTGGWFDDVVNWLSMLFKSLGGQNRDCFWNRPEPLKDMACGMVYHFDMYDNNSAFYAYQEISTY
jgi:hypothetical protein